MSRRCGMSRCRAARRRLALRGLAALGASVALAGCASLLGPRTVTIGEDELAQRLAARFPLDRRLLELLDMRVAAPRVRLLPESNRLGIDLELTLDERLSRRRFPVAVSLQSGLRFDATQSAVTLADVRVQRLRVDGMPEAAAETLQRFGAPLLESVLDGVAVHRFTQDQLEAASGRGWRPGAIDVTPHGVRITLQPVSR